MNTHSRVHLQWWKGCLLMIPQKGCHEEDGGEGMRTCVILWGYKKLANGLLRWGDDGHCLISRKGSINNVSDNMEVPKVWTQT